jgi:outer membrane lipoprotein-sorting protein
MWWATRIALYGLFLHPVLAQTQPNVAEILRKVSQTYKAAANYEFVADATVRTDGANKGWSSHLLFAFVSPNRYRMEGAFPGMGSDDPVPGKALMVHDGSTLWFYFPESNQYVTFKASDLTNDAPGDQGDVAPAAMDHFMMWRYRGAAGFSDARFLRDETLEFAGAKVDCYVVTVAQKSGGYAYTWWVDKQDSRILREDNAESSTVYTTVNLDKPLPDELFKFEPPPGARKVENQR